MTTATLEATPMTIDERYISATAASNLRVEADRSGSADLLIAAGWSAARIYAAMTRLQAEWDRATLPAQVGKVAIAGIAHDHGAMPSEAERETVYLSLRAKGLSHQDASKQARTKIADNKKAKDSAAQWFEHDAKLMMQRLKSLPEVRQQVARQAVVWKIADPVTVASAVILYWVAPVCPVCHGEKVGRNDAGKPTGRMCKPCAGTGNKPVPFGEAGKRLANWIDVCVEAGAGSVRRRLSRT